MFLGGGGGGGGGSLDGCAYRPPKISLAVQNPVNLYQGWIQEGAGGAHPPFDRNSI